MKKYLYIIIVLFFLPLTVYGQSFQNEKLKYIISYKWGLIHKDSGEATLTLTNNGSYYDIKLTGKTMSWADKIYPIRDTLQGRIEKDKFRPQFYIKSAHEKDRFSRDEIRYEYDGNNVKGFTKRFKQKKKNNPSTSTLTLNASGKVFDMLSIFYYLRSIDYSNIEKGAKFKTMMFSGSKVEELTITSEGIDEITLKDKKKVKAYHIKFRFTTEGRKKSSDDIDTWLSTDSAHIPLLIIGSLPVGQVRCYFVGKS